MNRTLITVVCIALIAYVFQQTSSAEATPIPSSTAAAGVKNPESSGSTPPNPSSRFSPTGILILLALGGGWLWMWQKQKQHAFSEDDSSSQNAPSTSIREKTDEEEGDGRC